MLYFITSNKAKILHAHLALDPYHISFKVKEIPIIEIQSTKIEEIAQDKANQAFNLLHQPVIVKDDGWFIEALNGFPGPFMKYVNTWLTVEDILRLMQNKTTRKVLFYEAICYKDKTTQKLFVNQIEGQLLHEPQGKDLPFSELATFRKDKMSMAESINKKLDPFDQERGWIRFAQWYKKEIVTS